MKWLTSIVLIATALGFVLAGPTSVQAVQAASADEGHPTIEALLRDRTATPPTSFTVDPLSGPIDTASLEGMGVGWQTRFVSDRDEGVELAVSLVALAPGESADWLARVSYLSLVESGREPIDAGGLHPGAVGIRGLDNYDDQAFETFTVLVADGDLFVEVDHIAPKSAVPATLAMARIDELLAAQLDQPIPPELADAWDYDEAAYLETFLVDDPGPAPNGNPLLVSPLFSGLVTSELLARTGTYGDETTPTEAADALLGSSIRLMRRAFVDPVGGIEAVVQLGDAGSQSRALTFLLGQRSALEAAGWTLMDRGRDIVVAVAPSTHTDVAYGVLALARRGGMLAYVTVGLLEPEIRPADSAAGAQDPEQAERLLSFATSLLVEQQQRLPEGATEVRSEAAMDPIRLASSAALAALGAIALGCGLPRAMSLRKSHYRHPYLPLDPPPVGVVAVTAAESQLRQNSRALSLLVYACIGASIAGLLLALWGDGVFGLLGAVGGIGTAWAIVFLIRRRGAGPRPGRGLRQPRLWRSTAASAIGTAAFLAGILAGGMYGMLSLVVGQSGSDSRSLAAADMARRFGGEVQDSLYSVVYFGGLLVAALVVALSMLVAGWAARSARKQRRLRAAELRARDPRPAVLFLRSFTDDKLKVRKLSSARQSLIEIIWPSSVDLFEAVIVAELDSVGPAVAIAPPGARLASLGAAREHAPDDRPWLDYVGAEMDRSGRIVVSLGRGDGLLQELRAIQAKGAFDRLILVFPPVAADELRARWTIAERELPLIDGGSLNLDPALVLTAAIDHGRMVAFTAWHRDEAGYVAALGAALHYLSDRDAAAAPSMR